MATADAQDASQRKDDDEKEIDLREYIGIVLDGWPWIAAFAVLGLLIATYFAWKTPPVYQATSLMRVEQSQNMAPQAFMEQQIAGASSNLKAVSAEAAVIRSRSVVGDAVDDLHLRVRAAPDYVPVIGEPIARFVTANFKRGFDIPFATGYAWGNESVNVTRIEMPEAVNSASFQLVANGDDQFTLYNTEGERVLQGQVGTTASGQAPGVGPVKIFVETLQARAGTHFTVSYVPRPAAIGSLQSKLTIVEQPQGSGLLNLTLLGGSPAEAERQLDAVMTSYIQQNVEKQSEQAQRRLDFLKHQLPELKEERDIAENKLREYQTESGTLDLSAEANSVFQRLTNIDQQIAQTELQRQELLQEYTQQAPQVQAANEKRASLVRQRNELQEQLKTLPQAESKLLQFRRDVEVNNQLYTQLLNTSQGLEITKAGITGVSHIVDSAYASAGKIAPNRGSWLLIGVLAGTIIAVLLVLMRALLRVTVDDPNEVESKFGLPLYATVPFSAWEMTGKKRKREMNLLAVNRPDDPTVESIRSLRTSLQFAMIEGDTKYIAITGPTPGCGKSFIAANTAALIAQTGSRVLLVDADLRRGQLFRAFGLEQGPGFSEVLSGDASVETAVQASGVENLDVLTTGKRPPNPAELLISRRFNQMKAGLESRYDYVLYDLPPILNVTDASIVANNVAATFLVVRSEHSTGHEVDQAIRRMNRDDLKLTGAIFNGLRVDRRRYGYGKYGYYAYKY
ncbi:Protein-tyrosine kinase chainlength regulator in capsular polysaccharide biosynthesi [Salinisphaera shabanensis E1L3A]|uniref:Protein-tyrosine kinase chainlength regulator in capsular polysaccharide biosynthesi n=1 Tax=Salinisphaera shabanensis E1L3A TaxID=1033802 RepID=U2EGN2_9GAMM|nr:polysaccharide biosynthesis tyrosine autokinase [Salinisphaera shabanensis]ERJ17547.1 Protein-tyrosine kinase chainlength regulator in capsular polysaccharide biosynthesi [Salinisphaera shabanensis E1L3A]